jgi:hypothetical protein
MFTSKKIKLVAFIIEENKRRYKEKGYGLLKMYFEIHTRWAGPSGGKKEEKGKGERKRDGLWEIRPIC